MIQRIQTIYLAVAFIAMGLLLVFPFSTYAGIEFNSLGFDDGTSVGVTYPLFINVIISAILSLLAVFSFKNRKRQILLSRINFAAVLILLIVMFVDFNQIEESLPINKTEISYGIGMFLPIVALISLLMANRFITKDEKLIKSMDRIR
ncbi:MAG: DUF4293 domain-containing protein [Flavobacteriales bacterium]